MSTTVIEWAVQGVSTHVEGPNVVAREPLLIDIDLINCAAGRTMKEYVRKGWDAIAFRLLAKAWQEHRHGV